MAAAGTTSLAGNLPVDLTTFVGRRSELSGVKRRLSSSRLVSLSER